MIEPPAVHVEGTAPYPWPWDGRISGDRLALVLAGWDEGWAGRVLDPAPRRDAIASLAAAVTAVGGLVVTVAHAGSPTLPSPVPLALVVDGPSPLRPVTAVGIDGFHGGPLDALLRSTGRTHLLVAGHGLEGPVHSTLRSANDRGYECLLVVDASAALTDDLVEASAKTVTMSGGIFGAIGRTDAVISTLATVPHPHPAQEAHA